MDHEEYIRYVEGSPLAVLMIHGIAGTPAHFRDLVHLIPEEVSLYNILLDGHSSTVDDFSRSSMEKWKQQAKQMLSQILSHHKKVIIVAHSMGTLFAIQGAVDHPEQVAQLFLLSVPTRPWVRFSTILTSLRVCRGNIAPDDAAAIAMRNDTGIRLERNPIKYIGWVPRLWELLWEIRRVRKLLPRLNVPTQTFQSQVDELVSSRSCKDLCGHPCIQNTVLYHSGHFAYGAEDTALLQNRFRAVLGPFLDNPS